MRETGRHVLAPDDDEFRRGIIEWIQAIHAEVQTIRRIAEFFFVLWLVGLAIAVTAVIQLSR